jgi:protein dithiol oxidoreductase (disulfide-forming)
MKCITQRLCLLFIFSLHFSVFADTTPLLANPDGSALFKAERDYIDISVRVPITEEGPADIELFFWYGCASCYQVFDHFSRWKPVEQGQLSMNMSPAMIRSDWRKWAKLYYALRQTGYLDTYQTQIFDAIHVQGQAFSSFDNMKSLFELEHQQAIQDSFNRAATNFLVKQSEQRYKTLEISSVPSILIKGRYLVTADMAQTTSRMRKIAAYLLEVKH